MVKRTPRLNSKILTKKRKELVLTSTHTLWLTTHSLSGRNFQIWALCTSVLPARSRFFSLEILSGISFAIHSSLERRNICSELRLQESPNRQLWCQKDHTSWTRRATVTLMSLFLRRTAKFLPCHRPKMRPNLMPGSISMQAFFRTIGLLTWTRLRRLLKALKANGMLNRQRRIWRQLTPLNHVSSLFHKTIR